MALLSLFHLETAVTIVTVVMETTNERILKEKDWLIKQQVSVCVLFRSARYPQWR